MSSKVTFARETIRNFRDLRGYASRRYLMVRFVTCLARKVVEATSRVPASRILQGWCVHLALAPNVLISGSKRTGIPFMPTTSRTACRQSVLSTTRLHRSTSAILRNLRRQFVVY